MNKELENYARQNLKDNISKCTDAEKVLFARMYGRFGYNDNIYTVIDGMDPDKLDWAMTQVKNTLDKEYNEYELR